MQLQKLISLCVLDVTLVISITSGHEYVKRNPVVKSAHIYSQFPAQKW